MTYLRTGGQLPIWAMPGHVTASHKHGSCERASAQITWEGARPCLARMERTYSAVSYWCENNFNP